VVRVLTASLVLLFGVSPVLTHAADLSAGQTLTIGADLSYISASGHPSWTEGFVGKLRYDSDEFAISRAFLDYKGKLTDTLDAHIALEGYDDDLGNKIGVTQAYLQWRPVPRSPTRYRLKVGAFYPRISLENVDPGWSSPYTMNSSAINTWVAEELRSTGMELSASRRPARFGGAHEFSINTAVFWGNDPAGSLLAWKGWSVHDRQTRFSDKLPLPPLPQIQPGQFFEAQDPYVTPFREIDSRAGYYVNAEWRFGKRFLVRAMHYDNRANPVIIDSGQYGWETIFEHIGVQATLPGDIGLIAQWMFGSTVMGPVVDGAHMVDVEYDSKYLLLTRQFGKHRTSLRYDHFEVSQNDETPHDNNPEYGHAWTLGYQFGYSKHAAIAAEWLSIKTHHCGWVYYGISPTATERQLQLTLQLRF